MGQEAATAEDPTPRRRRRVGLRRMLVYLIPIFHFLGLLSSVHAVMGTRTAQGAVAWAVSLNTFPYVAVPAYWVFGRSRFHGYVRARQLDEATLAESMPELREYSGEFEVGPEDGRELAGYQVVTRLTHYPVTRGNDAELLIDGEATFASIFEGIERAQDYVLVQFFIMKDDDIGTELQRRLIERAENGVRVYVVYDEVGSKLPRRYLRELREAGVEVTEFNTTQGPSNRLQLNFRNHRKIVVVDGREGWVGGHNVGDEYLGRDPKIGPWRDTHVRVEGPAVLELQASFIEDWFWATKRSLSLSWLPVASDTGDKRIIMVPTGPADEREAATLLFMQAILGAQERIWIASPYFVPDRDLLMALELADLRGVDVRILIPDRPDHIPVYLAAFTFLEELDDTGVRLYRYLEGFLHEKVALIDDRSAVVGTSNFDNRSMRLNFEVSALVIDQEFAGEVEEMFEADFARSRIMEPGEFAAKPFWFRFAARLARLTAPIQ